MQDVRLPGGAVTRGAPHAQAAALRLGVLVLAARLAARRAVLRAAGAAVCVGVPLACLPLLGALPLLAVPPPRCCARSGSDKA